MAILQLLGRTLRRSTAALNNNTHHTALNISNNNNFLTSGRIFSNNPYNSLFTNSTINPLKTRRLMRTQSFSNGSIDGLTFDHSTEKNIFTLKIGDNPPAYLKYKYIDSDSIDLMSTVVPKSLEGQGIAKILANAAFSFARENGLKIKPSCW